MSSTLKGMVPMCEPAVAASITCVGERSDAARMSIALTVLVSAEALGAAYGYASHPAMIQVRRMATLAIVIGTLLCLRVWIPSAIGNGDRRI